MNGLAERGATLLGGRLVTAEPLGGGDLSTIVRIALADGRAAIVKDGPFPHAEGAMLRAIAASGAPAPAVLETDDRTLVIAPLPNTGTLSEAWADLGIQLARLHAVTGARYGWDADYAFGPVAIENGWSDEWPTFWAARRLRPALPHVEPALARRIAALADDLTDRLPARPEASLLHGDLWGGNILSESGRITGLIDPACYYGHAEVDLAMLSLFDRPSSAFRDAYGDPEAGHAERAPIYALWPALVHLRLFGDGYRPMVDRLLTRAQA